MATSLKLVIVGDGAVGKSCLFISYTTNSFPSEYVPTVFDNYTNTMVVEGKAYNLAFWDTAGQEDYDRLRPLSYPQTDIFLLAFSIESDTSLQNIEHKWLPEIQRYCPDVPCLMVGCKSDLRTDTPSATTTTSRSDKMVSHKEAKEMADKLGLRYVETSALTQTGLKECFDYAVRLAVAGGMVGSKKKSWFSRGSKKNILIPPVMPPAGKAPWLEVATSVFADRWYQALQDPRFHDVTFVVEEGATRLHAHTILLCSASKFFARVLGVSAGGRTEQQRQMSAIDGYSDQDLNSGRVEGIASVYRDEEKTSQAGDSTHVKHTTVVLSADIKASTFLRVLEFLYTGVPRLPEDVADADLEELARVASIFKLPQLKTICLNIQNDEEFLNPSIGTFLNDETGATMKTLFFNQPECADVVFDVQGCSVYAHRVVLSTHSDVMAAMFSGHFSEGNEEITAKVNIPNTPVDTFLALLEYLYTDHAPIEEGDSVGILILADEYCVPRLCNLCELYITKEVDRHCSKQIEKSDIDVIGLLNTSQMYNAKQLVKWCLHFISSNFLSFENRKEFSNLTEDHRKHVTENRWPPVSYLKELEEYEKKMADKGEKCVVM